MITKIKTKTTLKDLEKIKDIIVITIYRSWPFFEMFPKSSEFWSYKFPPSNKKQFMEGLIFTGKDSVKNLGKPNNTIPDLESNPGIWIFENEEGVRMHVYSDCHRKNCFKGTSYELVNSKKITDDQLLNFLKEFKKLILG